jgi:hypothetical protein
MSQKQAIRIREKQPGVPASLPVSRVVERLPRGVSRGTSYDGRKLSKYISGFQTCMLILHARVCACVCPIMTLRANARYGVQQWLFQMAF